MTLKSGNWETSPEGVRSLKPAPIQGKTEHQGRCDRGQVIEKQPLVISLQPLAREPTPKAKPKTLPLIYAENADQCGIKVSRNAVFDLKQWGGFLDSSHSP